MSEENNDQVPQKKIGRPKGALGKHITLRQVVAAIHESGGVVMDTIKLLGLDVQTFYSKWRYHPVVEKEFGKAREMGFEAVTDVLYKKCLEGDKGAIQIYLKFNPLCKLKQWTEQSTLTIKAEKPLSDDEKKDLVKELFG